MNGTITNVTDTLYHVIPLDGSFLILAKEQPTFSFSVSLGDVLTIIGMLASFGVFCWQLHKTRKDNMENLRSTWFLDVVIQPNMEMINSFYGEIIKKVDETTNELSQDYKNRLAAIVLNERLAKKKRVLKNEIENNLAHFLSLLRASEEIVANEIDIVLDNLTDIVTDYVDNYENYSRDMSSKSLILNNKQEFVSKLYMGWNKSKKK